MLVTPGLEDATHTNSVLHITYFTCLNQLFLYLMYDNMFLIIMVLDE